MKRIIFYIAVFVCDFGILSAQNSKIDSLNISLQNAKEDTEKVNSLIAIGNELINVGDTMGVGYAHKAKDISEKIDYKKGIGRALHLLGRTFYAQGDYSMALKYHLDALNVRTEINDQTGMADSYNSAGLDYQNQGNYSEAMKYYLLALKIYEIDKSNMRGIGNVYMNLGSVALYQQNYDEALRNYTHSLNIMEQLGNKRGMASVYSNIGVAYHNQQQNNPALENFTKALKLNLEIGNVENIASNYNNIGIIYMDMENYTKALENYFIALSTAESNKNNYIIGNVFLNMGIVYRKQKKYALAEETLIKARDLARKIGSRNTVIECYNALATLSENRNDYKAAYDYYKYAAELKDSLINESNNKQIAEMKTKYETEKKDKEIVMQDAEIRKQKFIKYSAFTFSAIILLLGGLIFNNMRIRYRARRVSEQNEIRQKISRDLHDEIGSGLTTISMICEQAETKFAKDSNGALALSERIKIHSRSVSEKLREVVWATNPENDNLEVLFSYIRNYVSRYFENSSVSYSLNLPDEAPRINLAPDFSRNVLFVLKEALNNTIKHSSATEVEITFKIHSNKYFTFKISDNGKGLESITLPIQHNGIKNMRKRIAEIKGSFEIRSETGKGTQIEINGALT